MILDIFKIPLYAKQLNVDCNYVQNYCLDKKAKSNPRSSQIYCFCRRPYQNAFLTHLQYFLFSQIQPFPPALLRPFHLYYLKIFCGLSNPYRPSPLTPLC